MAAKAPPGLSARGRKLWRAVTEAYELRADERETLLEAARTADVCDRLTKTLAAEDVMVAGSTGQPRLNPIVAELGRQRDLLSRLLRRLDLPDLDVPPASRRATHAASARWKRRKALEDRRARGAAEGA